VCALVRGWGELDNFHRCVKFALTFVLSIQSPVSRFLIYVRWPLHAVPLEITGNIDFRFYGTYANIWKTVIGKMELFCSLTKAVQVPH
jgi:hypothetical protein